MISNDTYHCNDWVFWRSYGDNLIVISHISNEVLLLNGTASKIFRYILKPRSLKQIIQHLCSHYDVAETDILTDVVRFLSILQEFSFLESDAISSKRGALNNDRLRNGGDRTVTQWAADRLIPLNAQIEITRYCNLSCRHCYLPEHPKLMMDAALVRTILAQLRDAGCLFLTLTGGEPLLHKNITDIIKEAIKSYGFSVSIYTNGTCGIKKSIDLLAEFPIREVHVSMYSLNPKQHDEITGIEGSHQRTVDFVKALRRRGVRTIIKSPLFWNTICEVDKMRGFADAIGADWVGGPMITPRNNGDFEPARMRANEEQIVEYFSKLKGVSTLKRDNYASKNRSTKLLACVALSNSCFIDVMGDLYPCSQVRTKIGNLSCTTFSELWNNSDKLIQVREIRIEELPTCSKCDLLDYCTRCPGLAELEDGSILARSTFDCALARCRKKSEGSSGSINGKF